MARPPLRTRYVGRPNPIDKVLPLLKNVSASGNQWSARCPAHADHSNSLSVAVGRDGRVLLYCHAGCDLDEIADALELSMTSLFSRQQRRRKLRRTDRKE